MTPFFCLKKQHFDDISQIKFCFGMILFHMEAELFHATK